MVFYFHFKTAHKFDPNSTLEPDLTLSHRVYWVAILIRDVHMFTDHIKVDDSYEQDKSDLPCPSNIKKSRRSGQNSIENEYEYIMNFILTDFMRGTSFPILVYLHWSVCFLGRYLKSLLHQKLLVGLEKQSTKL